jgi:hypothetical protein
MLTLLPLGSAAQPQSPRGIQLHGALERGELIQERVAYRTAVSAAVSEWNKPIDVYGQEARRRKLDYLSHCRIRHGYSRPPWYLACPQASAQTVSQMFRPEWHVQRGLSTWGGVVTVSHGCG